MSNKHTCRICKKDFNGIDHLPVLLPCLHYFGNKCMIQKIVAKTFKCPQCFMNVDIQNISDKRKFPVILQFIEIPSVKHNGRCSICETYESDYFCFTCSSELCQNCYNRHFMFRFVNHMIVRIPSLKRLTNSEIQRDVCHKHFPAENELFCTECNESVCSFCAVTDHKNHDFISIDEKLKSIQRKLTQLKKGRILHEDQTEKIESINSSFKRPASCDETSEKEKLRKALESAELILESCRLMADMSVLVSIEGRLEDLGFEFDECTRPFSYQS